MRRKPYKIKVVKVPSDKKVIEYPQTFPRMPRLYLELIENKSKIKQDLINKEYVPPSNTSGNSVKTPDLHDFQKQSIDSNRESKVVEKIEKLDQELETLDEKINIERSGISKRLNMLLSDDSDDEDQTEIKENSLEIKEDDGNESDDSDYLSERLKSLLKQENMDSDSESGYASSVDSYRRKIPNVIPPRQNYNQSNNYAKRPSPPTLAELQQNGGYQPRSQLRDINQINPNEAGDEDAKREILFKFELLKKSYPGSNVPEYTIHTDMNTLQRSYDDCVRRLSLDSTVESYKTYLVYGFMGCEFLLGNFLGFDMQGFTQQQIVQMHSYEKLLIELGEKSYVPSGSSWPVELRLLFMIIMNAAFFLVSKMMMKKTGANLMGMINTMSAKKKATSNAPKRKMRGPTINYNDIPSI